MVRGALGSWKIDGACGGLAATAQRMKDRKQQKDAGSGSEQLQHKHYAH